jgi:hypothetical protein
MKVKTKLEIGRDIKRLGESMGILPELDEKTAVQIITIYILYEDCIDLTKPANKSFCLALKAANIQTFTRRPSPLCQQYVDELTYYKSTSYGRPDWFDQILLNYPIEFD